MKGGAVIVALAAAFLGCIAAGVAANPPGSYGALYQDDAYRWIAAACVGGVPGLIVLAWARGGGVPGGGVPGWAVAVIVATGVLARLVVMVQPPMLSTDIYRYAWDGRVQAAGINPYCCLPVDGALSSLRDAGAGAGAVFANINRADSAPTIYPPAAQVLFAGLAFVAPGIWGIKAAMLGFDLVTGGVILLLLRAMGRPAVQVVVWAWSPLVVWEFAGGGHVDAAALGFSALALYAAVRGRGGWAGGMLGLAVLMKLLPGVLFPAVWRWGRGGWRAPVAAGGVIIALYGLYAGAGLRVFGYLPGYAAEEHLDDGGGFLLLRLLRLAGPLPGWAGGAYVACGLLLIAGLGVWIVGAAWPAAPEARARVIARDALLLSGALAGLLSPHYPWYLTILVLPAALLPAWSALWAAIAAPLLYLDHGRDAVVWPALVFLPAVPLFAIDLWTRLPAVRRPHPGGA